MYELIHDVEITYVLYCISILHRFNKVLVIMHSNSPYIIINSNAWLAKISYRQQDSRHMTFDVLSIMIEDYMVLENLNVVVHNYEVRIGKW